MASKVYVGNLPFELVARDVEAVFRKFGRCKCSLKRGFAFLYFDHERDGEAAVREMDNSMLHGRRIKVEFSSKNGETAAAMLRSLDYNGISRRDEVSPSLQIENIPPHLKMRELEDYFESLGRVLRIKILPQARGDSAISALVDFADVADAKRAHEGGMEVGGARLRSEYIPQRTDVRNIDRLAPLRRERSRSPARPERRDRSRSPERRERSRDRHARRERSPARDRRRASPARRSPPRERSPARRSPPRERSPPRRSPPRERSPPRRSPPRERSPPRHRDDRSPPRRSPPPERSPPRHRDERSPPRERSPSRRSPPRRRDERSPQRASSFDSGEHSSDQRSSRRSP